jgi:hypothetical protein
MNGKRKRNKKKKNIWEKNEEEKKMKNLLHHESSLIWITILSSSSSLLQSILWSCLQFPFQYWHEPDTILLWVTWMGEKNTKKKMWEIQIIQNYELHSFK